MRIYYLLILASTFFSRATLPLGESSNDCEVHCPYYNMSGKKYFTLIATFMFTTLEHVWITHFLQDFHITLVVDNDLNYLESTIGSWVFVSILSVKSFKT